MYTDEAWLPEILVRSPLRAASDGTVMLSAGKMPLKAQLIGGLVVPLVQFLTPAAGGVVQLMKPLHKC